MYRQMESQKVYPEVIVVKTKNGKAWVVCCHCGKTHDHGAPTLHAESVFGEQSNGLRTSGIHFRSSHCHRGEYWFKV